MLAELMDFGTTLTFFRGVNDDIKKRIAENIHQPDRVVMSWLLALNTVRNRCAHHARLWDWEIGTPVLTPQRKKFPMWHSPALPNNRIGIALTICRYWQNQISPTNGWTQRILNLFDEFTLVDPVRMGLPIDWRNHPLWRT
jgi:abortive infection bacteriophage resistance protein